MKNAIESLLAKFIIISGFVVLCAAAAPVYAGTPTIVSAKITSPNAVTIYFSEPVTTAIGDYTNFTGALAGQYVSALSGSGTGTVILTFSGNNFNPSSTGSLSVAATTVSVSDRTAFGGSATVQISDGQAPTISSFTVSSNNANNSFAKSGNILTVMFNSNEITTTPKVTIAGQSVSVSGIGAGPYSSSYTLRQADAQNSIPIAISITDAAGNGSRLSFSIANDAAAGIATITSNASASGALKLGDSIVFTLVPASPVPNAKVSGSYNGVPLSWVTVNNGATYTTTYTAGANDKDQTTPLQISNVVITDQNGNQSAPASGYDVMKTISVTMPVITEITPVPSAINTATPIYTFSSTKEGTIQWGGDCVSPVLSAAQGLNTIIFSKMIDGLHNNCSLTVTDSAGNISNKILLSGFTIAAGNAAPVQQTAQQASVASSIPVTPPSVQSSSPAYVFTLPLKLGSTGNEVRELQKKLTVEGVYSGPVNGNLGPLTSAAVKKFQKLHGLEQLGSVGPGTRAALNK